MFVLSVVSLWCACLRMAGWNINDNKTKSLKPSGVQQGKDATQRETRLLEQLVDAATVNRALQDQLDATKQRVQKMLLHLVTLHGMFQNLAHIALQTPEMLDRTAIQDRALHPGRLCNIIYRVALGTVQRYNTAVLAAKYPSDCGISPMAVASSLTRVPMMQLTDASTQTD